MTRSERFRKDRAWLKTHHFCTTNTLRRKLDETALPTQERERLAYIQNKIIITADEDWAGVSRRYWADKCGSRYRSYLDRLVEWGEIEVDPSYRATDDRTGYPMRYRVPKDKWDAGLCNVDFHRQRVRRPTPRNNPSDDVSRFVLKKLSELSVAVELALPEAPERRSRIRDHCEHIAFGDYGLTYGRESRRLFHRVVMMPSEGRLNLTHPFGLVEYDVKSCHPVLLLPYFTDAAERRRYAELLEGDVYATIADFLGGKDRNDLKTDLLVVVNARRKTPEWLRTKGVFQYFHEHFPRFTQDTLATRPDLALTLQNAEADLMVHQLGSFCREKNLFWIPQHDGWITTPHQEQEILGEAKRIIERAVRFTPALQPKARW